MDLSYQETRGVVQQAAETTAETSLQEGWVFWRDALRVVGHDTADICRGLLTYNTNEIMNFPALHSLLLMSAKLHSSTYLDLLGLPASLSCWPEFGLRAKWSCLLKIARSSVWINSNTLWWMTSDWKNQACSVILVLFCSLILCRLVWISQQIFLERRALINDFTANYKVYTCFSPPVLCLCMKARTLQIMGPEAVSVGTHARLRFSSSSVPVWVNALLALELLQCLYWRVAFRTNDASVNACSANNTLCTDRQLTG